MTPPTRPALRRLCESARRLAELAGRLKRAKALAEALERAAAQARAAGTPRGGRA